MTFEQALESLTAPKFPAREIPDNPGLYAVYGPPKVWEELGLGKPPDSRPLYVGKAEESLYRREYQTHFGGGKGSGKSTTGSSTLRRSFAALLKSEHGFSGIPRNIEKPGYFTSYGLSASDDRKLTEWMADSLLVAVWCPNDEVDLGAVETQILLHWIPPLNLSKVKTPWKSMLSEKRALMAEEAERWGQEAPEPTTQENPSRKSRRAPKAKPASPPRPGLTQYRMDQASTVSALLQEYLLATGDRDAKPADAMPFLISKGAFRKDGKPGQYLRELLRELDKADSLDLIPQVTVVRAGKNRKWFLNPVTQ